MNKIMVGWKEYRFGDLVTSISKALAHTKDEVDECDPKSPGAIPFVSRTEPNNSVDFFVTSTNLEGIEKGNALVIGDTTSTISYQEKEFVAGDHIVVIRADWLNRLTGLFVVTLLRKERFRYSYGRAFTMDLIANTKIKLPASPSGEPDWLSVEKYMGGLRHKQLKTSRRSSRAFLETETWRTFQIKDIFNVKYGVNLELNALEETTEEDAEGVAFVGRSADNNGVTAFVKRINDVTPQRQGALTVAGGGSVLSTFLQTRDFYSGRDLYLLLEKEPMSVCCKLFIKTIIEQDKYRFNYGRQANKSLPYLEIKLPVDDKGKPDWDYMERFMRKLPLSEYIA